MVTREIRRARCDDALKLLSEGGRAVFFTLTTPDEVDFPTIRARWRDLRHSLVRALRRKYPNARIEYVMNYEAHPGYLQKLVSDPKTRDRVIRSDGRPHGWHIHGVINCFVDLRVFRRMLDQCGFGRVDVRRVTSRGVSDYLTKHALKAYRGLSAKERRKYAGARMRLVNASRGLPALNEYAYRSVLLDDTRLVMSEAREIEKETKLRLRDYRVVYQRAQVCSLLGLSHLWQLSRFLEALKDGGPRFALGLASRLRWRGVFEQAQVTSGTASAQNSPEGAVREGVFEERRNDRRDFALSRSREALRVKEKKRKLHQLLITRTSESA